MKSVLDCGSISFSELELGVLRGALAFFVELLREVLESLDQMLLQERDRSRYELRGKRERQLETLVGVVRFSRRLYLDRETGEYVALLDESLGLEKGSRVSPNLVNLATLQAVLCPSYRAATKTLEQLYGHQVLSAESIRQLVLKVGQEIAHEEERNRAQPEGDRRVEVLYLEADGLWLSLQREQRGKCEVQMVMSHEGWCKRHPQSQEYELLHRGYHLGVNERDF